MNISNPETWLAESARSLPQRIIGKNEAIFLIQEAPDAILRAKVDSVKCAPEAARLLLDFYQRAAPDRACMLATESFMKHPELMGFLSEYPRLFADPVTRNMNAPISRLAQRLAFHRLTQLPADVESLRADLMQARARYPKLRLGFFEEKINLLTPRHPI